MIARRTAGRILAAVVGLVAASVAANHLFVRPRVMNWGATEAECREALPGDDLVPNPISTSTRAVTIEASPADVWPWIVQMGHRRAGWYSHDWIEGLLGAADYVDGHSADRIHPELQGLRVGDRVAFSGGNSAPVVALEPNRHLVLGGSWAFVLRPTGARRTRLIVRTRHSGFLGHFSRRWGPILRALDLVLNYAGYEPGLHLLMERKMMLGIKERAERLAKGRSRLVE